MKVTTEEQKVPPVTDTANLAEIDSLLTELDPEFSSNLGKINSEIGQMAPIAGLESLTLSADYLKESSENKGDEIETSSLAPDVARPDFKPEEMSQRDSFLEILKELTWVSLFLPFQLVFKVFRLALTLKSEPPIEVLKNAPDVLLPPLYEWLVLVRAFLQKIRGYSPVTYFKVALIIFLLGVIRLTLIDMKSRIDPDREKDPFLQNWSEVADKTYAIPLDAQNENIDDPLRHPEYTVLIHRIVANLKPPNKRATPMVVAELYIEASNQDAAIEIHDRELEVRDSLERVFEDTSFDELDSKGGKERLKIHIRSALDQMLNKGHVKRVFFSSLNMVP